MIPFHYKISINVGYGGKHGRVYNIMLTFISEASDYRIVLLYTSYVYCSNFSIFNYFEIGYIYSQK